MTLTRMAFPDAADFIDRSTARRQLMTELHLRGALTLAELAAAVVGPRRWVRWQLARLERRGLLTRVSLEAAPTAQLFALTA